MNSFMNNLKSTTNYGYTENHGLKHVSTGSAVLDLFALGGSYRTRSEADCIVLFQKALAEDEVYALKCLFYLRDIPGKGNGGCGQGERRFFRVCMRWLAKNHTEMVRRNIENIPLMGRYDDLYCLFGTPCEKDTLKFIKHQLELDVQTKTPSLLAKWLPSENTSSAETCRNGNIVRKYLNFSHKQYRKTLTILRKRINVLERLMSENRWSEIEFDKIPSKAGIKYKNAFARHDVERARASKQTYENFAKDTTTKVNASTLYPYEIVNKVTNGMNSWYGSRHLTDTDRNMINKYWRDQKDWLNGKPCKMMCVCDTSASMRGTPLDVAISLSMYCAERLNGPFKNHYISFSRQAKLIEIVGTDFVDKVERIYKSNLCESTDLQCVFDLLLDVSKRSNTNDIPDTVVVISDMEINAATHSGTSWYGGNSYRNDPWNRSFEWTNENAQTMMEQMRLKWSRAGIKMPRLIYWNVNARNDTILDLGKDVSYVSGMSPSIFQQVITGKTGYDLMMEVLNNVRYKTVK